MTYADTARLVHHGAGLGEQVRLITDLVTRKASAADTTGAWSLYEVETPPSGGYPAHRQRHDDEGIYVLEGHYTFLVDTEEVKVGRGEFLLIPRGTVHGYVNSGQSSARMLVIVTPAGITDQFIDDAGDSADRPVWQPDMAKVLAVAPKYGIEFMTAGDPEV